MDFLVNGRFLARPPTGVDRFAFEIVRALAAVRDRRAAGDGFRIDIAVPPLAMRDDAIRGALGLSSGDRVHRSTLSGYFWEQTVLTRLRPGSMLLSLCNLGPVLRRRQLIVMHDAQIFDAPASYSARFRFAYRMLQPLLAKRAAIVATVSAFSAGRLTTNGIGRYREIAILPNGGDHFDRIVADPDALRHYGLTPNGYFLAVGGAMPHKNVAMLTRANALRTVHGLPVVLAGGGPPCSRACTAADGAMEGVRSLGRVSDAELKALYCSAAAFLFPSTTEGFGLPAIEAMACGCPVIASDRGAIPEVCGNAPLYCDPNEPIEWAEAMDRFAREPDLRVRMANAARARSAEFRWEKSAQLLLGAVAGVGES